MEPAPSGTATPPGSPAMAAPTSTSPGGGRYALRARRAETALALAKVALLEGGAEQGEEGEGQSEGGEDMTSSPSAGGGVRRRGAQGAHRRVPASPQSPATTALGKRSRKRQSAGSPTNSDESGSRKAQLPTSSRFRGVTRHCRTGRWEAHIWDMGKQVYLGGFDVEEQAALAYDMAAIKLKGRDAATTNFERANYDAQRHVLESVTKEELIATLRRHSRSPSAKQSSIYKGVTRHQKGRWEARIGQVNGKKYKYLGLYDTEVEAAQVYDREAIALRGLGAVTNFALVEYKHLLSPEQLEEAEARGLLSTMPAPPPTAPSAEAAAAMAALGANMYICGHGGSGGSSRRGSPVVRGGGGGGGRSGSARSGRSGMESLSPVAPASAAAASSPVAHGMATPAMQALLAGAMQPQPQPQLQQSMLFTLPPMPTLRLRPAGSPGGLGSGGGGVSPYSATPASAAAWSTGLGTPGSQSHESVTLRVSRLAFEDRGSPGAAAHGVAASSAGGAGVSGHGGSGRVPGSRLGMGFGGAAAGGAPDASFAAPVVQSVDHRMRRPPPTPHGAAAAWPPQQRYALIPTPWQRGGSADGGAFGSAAAPGMHAAHAAPMAAAAVGGSGAGSAASHAHAPLDWSEWVLAPGAGGGSGAPGAAPAAACDAGYAGHMSTQEVSMDVDVSAAAAATRTAAQQLLAAHTAPKAHGAGGDHMLHAPHAAGSGAALTVSMQAGGGSSPGTAPHVSGLPGTPVVAGGAALPLGGLLAGPHDGAESGSATDTLSLSAMISLSPLMTPGAVAGSGGAPGSAGSARSGGGGEQDAMWMEIMAMLHDE